jgi:hypothetical protein
MSKFLLTACAFGLLLSSAFAEEKSREQLREERSHIFGIEGQESQSFNRVVASGTKQRIGFYAALNPDCTASGDVNVSRHQTARTWHDRNCSDDKLRPLCKRKYPL